jgi:hypothetical protein
VQIKVLQRKQSNKNISLFYKCATTTTLAAGQNDHMTNQRPSKAMAKVRDTQMSNVTYDLVIQTKKASKLKYFSIKADFLALST